MIQRIQTLYLLIAAGLLTGLFFIPMAEASMMCPQYPTGEDIREYLILYIYGFKGNMLATPNWFVFTTALLGASLLLAVTAIFLFKKRRVQQKLVLLLILLLLGVSAMSVYQYQLFEGFRNSPLKIGGYDFQMTTQWAGFFFAPACIILALLALRGIRKDEKLVRSLDRLR